MTQTRQNEIEKYSRLPKRSDVKKLPLKESAFMPDQPIIALHRVQLRFLESSDATAIQQTACAREIADTMISIPHPYPAGEARKYVDRQRAEGAAGHSTTFVIERKADHLFCGLAELREIDPEHSQGELSFWLRADFWGRGYMSEVIGAVARYGFEHLGLNRIYAYHMVRNPACGRVLQKNGFKQEGLLRQRVRKWGVFEDVALWALLRRDWQRDMGI